MHHRRRRSLLAAASLIALVGCGAVPDGEPVEAGAPELPAASTTVEPVPTTGAEPPAPSTTAPPGSVPPTTVARPATPSTTTTTTAPAPPVPAPTESGTSVVAGLSPEQLAEAVTAPTAPSLRGSTGPSVERLTVDGREVWRIRIPGDFPVRAVRASVAVGDRPVGQGVVAPDLRSLVAITLDGRGLMDGAPVSYTWEGSKPTAAGRLVVAR